MISEQVLLGLEQQVEQALRSGVQENLDILGYGEISTVLNLRMSSGRFACKRLPLFESQRQIERYKECFELYIEKLTERGVNLAKSSLEVVKRDDDKFVGYCIQPALSLDFLATEILARTPEKKAQELFSSLVTVVTQAIEEDKLGLDAQLSNWAFIDDKVVYFDVTTPMIRDEEGKELLDLDIFLASLPWAIRGIVRKWMLKDILDHYYFVRNVLLDLLANLYKERLDRFLPGFITIVNQEIAQPLTLPEVKQYYRSDARDWALLQRLRKMDRFWQRYIRRRVYPFILPGRIKR